jgi:hypothetical protein
MPLKKYTKISPSALRAFTFYASCLVRQFRSPSCKNTMTLRQLMRIFIHFRARVPAELPS